MGALHLAEWQRLPMSLSELCINTTLRCGQSFRWRKSDSGVWSIALHNRILALHQDPEFLYYRCIPSHPSSTAPLTPPASLPDSPHPSSSLDSTSGLDLITSYFNLSPSLSLHDLYTTWSTSDSNFASKAPRFTGIRILRQDAWEALVCFICSSNNHISRISGMVQRLCTEYGKLVGRMHPETCEQQEASSASEIAEYHDFPPPSALAQEGVEARLRALGFGYRARYIAETARMVHEGREEGWLEGLRNSEDPGEESGKLEPGGRAGYRAAHAALLALSGVGPKVADCVCLMGLGWGEAVPVDTHVWQIAKRDYGLGRGGRGQPASLTKEVYAAVGDKFRELWGREAGWAQSVLFTANLKSFSERLVEKKKEVKQEEETEVKKAQEEGGEDLVVRRSAKVLSKAIKREAETGERKTLEVEETTVVRRKAKRRRRA